MASSPLWPWGKHPVSLVSGIVHYVQWHVYRPSSFGDQLKEALMAIILCCVSKYLLHDMLALKSDISPLHAHTLRKAHRYSGMRLSENMLLPPFRLDRPCGNRDKAARPAPLLWNRLCQAAPSAHCWCTMARLASSQQWLDSSLLWYPAPAPSITASLSQACTSNQEVLAINIIQRVLWSDFAVKN